MAGAYCGFCGTRCFVYRIIPDGPSQGGWHLATCRTGMEHDRRQTGGYDHTNTVNPSVSDARVAW